jgi:serine/threonine protein kinase
MYASDINLVIFYLKYYDILNVLIITDNSKLTSGTNILKNDIGAGVVNLTDKEFIGEGCHKKCYIHPEDSFKCIKILYDTSINAQKQLEREIKYNEKLKERNVPILPKYYGEISTNMGKGYAFELIKNSDGSTPCSLSDYLLSETLLRENFSNLLDALKKLKSDMLFFKVITMALYPQNILYKHDDKNGGSFIIIDDIGSAALIPIEYYFTFAARARIERKWKRFVENIEKEYDNPLAKELAKKIR